MKSENDIKLKLKTIREFISNAQISKSFDILLSLLLEVKSEYRNQLILLYSDFNAVSNSEKLGIGEHRKDKNRIIYSLLELTDKVENELKLFEFNNTDSTIEEKYANLASKIKLLEQSIETLTESISSINNSLFLSLRNSSLWNSLLPDTKKVIEVNNIILNDRDLDNYTEIIKDYVDVFRNELMSKLFNPYRQHVIDKVRIVKGNNLEEEIAVFNKRFPGHAQRKLVNFIETGELTFSLFDTFLLIFQYGFGPYYGDYVILFTGDSSIRETVFLTEFPKIIKSSFFIKNRGELEGKILTFIGKVQIFEKIIHSERQFLLFSEKEAREVENLLIQILINMVYKG